MNLNVGITTILLEMSKEFVINALLSARFNSETRKTEVYVCGEMFRQCKFILLVNPNETISKEINSIDEAVEQMSHVLEKQDLMVW